MALIVLYCFALACLLSGIHPLATVGTFLGFCYLPGLCLFALIRNKAVAFEDLVLAFPVSIGLSSLLTIGLLFLGSQVGHIPFITLSIIGAVIVYALASGKIKHGVPVIQVSKKEILFSCFALLLTLALSIPFFTGVNRIGISGHAFHHSLLVTQILNGIFPPENPGLGGTIIGYYWGFHALIAALTARTDFHQIQIMFMLNAVSLYVIFCLSYIVAASLKFSESYRYILPVAVLGLMRADAGIVFLGKLFSGNVLSFGELTASPVEPYGVLSHWISGLPWTDTRLFFLHKLYNVSGMLLALSLCYAYVLLLVRNNFSLTKRDGISIALIITGCVLNYPPLAIFLLMHAPLWTACLYVSSRGSMIVRVKEALYLLVPYIAAGLMVSPYILTMMASRNISSGGQGGILSFDVYSQSLKNIIVFAAVLPAVIYGVAISLKKLYLSRAFFFLTTATLLCLILTMFTRWPFDNSYKFNYVLTLFFSLFFLYALSHLLSLISSTRFQQSVIGISIVSLILTPLMVESSHIVSSLSTDYVYSFSGKHLIYAQDRKKNEAYSWIRDNTPVDALLMLGYTETNWPCCGFNNNYEPGAIAERALYLIKDKDYTMSSPEYERRIQFRQRLFEEPDDPSVTAFFVAIGRPVYLLLERDLDAQKFYVEKRFASFPLDLGDNFELVFKNDTQRVYHLRPDR